MRMPKHGREDLRVQGIPQTRNEREDQEQHEVQREEYLGNDFEPVPVVRQLVQQDGDDARAHGNDEPSSLTHSEIRASAAKGKMGIGGSDGGWVTSTHEGVKFLTILRKPRSSKPCSGAAEEREPALAFASLMLICPSEELLLRCSSVGTTLPLGAKAGSWPWKCCSQSPPSQPLVETSIPANFFLG